MILGILSDTHGRADAAIAAVRLLLDHGATQLVHCGDVGSLAVLDAMAGHPASFVFGNNDWNQAELARYANDLGIACGGASMQLNLGDGKIAMITHGDDAPLIARVLREQRVDYLLVGHSHRQLDQRQGRVRIVNPGALYRAATKTVAVLDPATDRLQFLMVDV